MPDYTQTINSFNELSAELIPKEYLPTIYDICFKRKRSELANRIPRNSEGVHGLKVFLTFLTSMPWAWRAMSEFGYTPTGSKFAADEQEAQLGCHASNAIVSLTELAATEQGRWVNIIDKQMSAIGATFPHYMRGLIWSSQNAKKALGKVASVSGLTVTLDNAGLWNTKTADRAKLFERGMFLQSYRGSAKVGQPVRVDAVDKALGTITLSADPGLADNDTFSFSDIAGLDQPYSELFPGLLDVIDDDNTFQGIDRSAAANADFRAVVQDGGAAAPTHAMLTDFFHKVYDPDTAYTSWKVVRKYWEDNIAANIRYTPSGVYVDGVEGVKVGRTNLMVDDDVDEDKIIVTDFANLRIADRGGFENLFGKGWQQVAGRPFLEYSVVYWAIMLAEDTRYMGQLHNIDIAA